MIGLLFSDPIAARRFCAAVDIVLGYPREHTRAEPDLLIGRRIRVMPRTETKCRVMRHNVSGVTFVIIDEEVDALHGRIVSVSDGGLRQITIATSGAGITRISAPPAGWPATLAAVNPWVDRPPRDGLGGAR